MYIGGISRSIIVDEFSKRDEGIAFSLETLDNRRKGIERILPDVMQEDDASRLSLSHDIFCEPFWIFLFPVIRIDIPTDDRTMMERSYATILIAIRESKKEWIFSGR